MLMLHDLFLPVTKEIWAKDSSILQENAGDFSNNNNREVPI